MGRFLARRLLQSIGTLLLASFVFHTALSLLPGDPVRALFGAARPDPGVYEAMRAQYHFDQPWYGRWWRYVADLASGDWGRSFPGQVRGRVQMGPPVADILQRAVPVSLRLLLGVLACEAVLGVAAGVFAVRRRHRPLGEALHLGALVAVAVPVIVWAFVLQSVFGQGLGWLPLGGLADWRGYVLPVVALSTTSTAYVVLLTRSELGQALGEVFIQAAFARAVPEGRVVGLHALRASLVTIVTFIAANFGQLLTGLIVVEGVFGIPGVGAALLGAIRLRDFALLIAMLLFAVAVVLVANLVADVLQTVIDPRVRRTGERRSNLQAGASR